MVEDSKPFIAWDFMAKGKNSNSGKSNVSLELSLSPPSTTLTDHYKKTEHCTMLWDWGYCMEKRSRAFQSESSNANAGVQLELSLSVGQHARNTRWRCMDKCSGAFPSDSTIADTNLDAHLPTGLPLLVDYMSCMEKSSGASPTSEPTETNADADISLELSLSTMYGGSNSKHDNQKPKDGFPSGKKRQRMEENQQLSTTGRKKSKVEAETMRMRMGAELRLGQGHDPWCIKKKLVVSDVGHLTRLLLPKMLVESEILPHWNADQEAGIEKGVEVSFLDCDTNTRYDGIQFKQWKNGAYVFIKKWVALVRARQLKINDEIGLYWDNPNSTFKFSLLNRPPTK